MQPIFKTLAAARASGDDPREYVLSDETPDRIGDVIAANGWELGNFRKNPIALFGHRADFIVGHWKNIRIDGKRLIGHLELLPKGISDRLDEIIAAVEAGVLRAVSVGFRKLDAEPGERGMRYTKQELVEASLVAVPANPNALQIAKALHLSDDTQRLIFGEPADPGHARRGATGEPAATAIERKAKPMNLAQRIQATEQELVTIRDKLAALIGKEQPADEDAEAIDEATKLIAAKDAEVARLKRAEHALGIKSDIVVPGAPTSSAMVTPAAGNGGDAGFDPRRPFALPAKKIQPRDYILRSAVCQVIAHVTRKSIDEVRQARYGDDEVTKLICDVVTKAATAPATTTTSGWASQLIETVVADFMLDLMPQSVYPGLSARGLRLTFGRSGQISIPSRLSTPTIAGSFVLEGNPIPVRQGAFSSTTLTPKKLGVITTFTREIGQHSTPAIEGLLRDAIQADTAVAIDSVLLDATAATATRPAGIRAGVGAITATVGGGFTALVGDIKALIGALITGTNGNVRSPVWIMNPIQAISISLTQNAGGDFPFAQEINQGRFQGYPLIQSSSVTAGMVILVDAADFVSVTGDEPMFDVSDQAVVHMEDTTPLAIGTVGSPNTVAAPTRSLWQTDSLGIRMILPMNWTFRRSGIVAWTQAVTW